MMEELVIKELLKRCQELEQDVLVSPPVDYAALRQMVGHHAGLRDALSIIEKVLRGKEEM